MNARTIGIAAAAVLAAACRTSGSQSSAGTASAEPSGRQGSETTASDRPRAGEDPLMQPGPAVKGHASDRVVSGNIDHVSPVGVDIVSDRGEVVRLEIVPETAITVDGANATYLELEEGQPVRASYNEMEGRIVAIEIRASPLPGGTPGMSPPGPTDTGSTGSEPTDTGSMGSGSSDTGSTESGSGSSPTDTGSTGTGSIEPPDVQR